MNGSAPSSHPSRFSARPGDIQPVKSNLDVEVQKQLIVKAQALFSKTAAHVLDPFLLCYQDFDL
jgi:hypothetical protein